MEWEVVDINVSCCKLMLMYNNNDWRREKIGVMRSE